MDPHKKQTAAELKDETHPAQSAANRSEASSHERKSKENSSIPPSEPIARAVAVLPVLPDGSLVIKKKILANVLSTLPVHNRDELYMIIRDILRQSHVYYYDWQDIKVGIQLIGTVVDIIRRYDLNGLQMNGDSLKLLYQLASVSSSTVITASLSDNSVIELILRLLLEHPIYDICICILDIIISSSTEPTILFSHIGDIGKSFLLFGQYHFN